jgi:hypothetical protein
MNNREILPGLFIKAQHSMRDHQSEHIWAPVAMQFNAMGEMHFFFCNHSFFNSRFIKINRP